jgi:thiol-disulfide isomerase/thioredoxin
MKNLLSLLLLLFTLLACTQKADEFQINLKLEGQKYQGLYIGFLLDNDKSMRIYGKTSDGYNWNFSIPKDIYEQHNIALIADSAVGKDCYHYLVFGYVNDNGDTLSQAENYNLEEIINIDAKFVKNYISKEPIWVQKGDSIVSMTIRDDEYIIPQNQGLILLKNKEFLETFSWFDNWNHDMKLTSYDMELTSYIKAAEENPDNKILARRLYNSRGIYRSTDDIRKVFEKFSNEVKSSHYGSKINDYLEKYDYKYMTEFENHNLLSMQSGVKEPIIQDTSKYNLIIFSASWCGPCRAAIPKYKQIYDDLSDKIIMTYVSTDKPEDVDKWKKLMDENEIKWRSLFAMDEQTTVSNKYYVRAIPSYILLSPSKKMERLQDVEDIYKIVNQ